MAILKSSTFSATLVSTERMMELLEAEDNVQLLSIALSRLENSNEVISKEDFLQDAAIDPSSLSELPEIELE